MTRLIQIVVVCALCVACVVAQVPPNPRNMSSVRTICSGEGLRSPGVLEPSVERRLVDFDLKLFSALRSTVEQVSQIRFVNATDPQQGHCQAYLDGVGQIEKNGTSYDIQVNLAIRRFGYDDLSEAEKDKADVWRGEVKGRFAYPWSQPQIQAQAQRLALDLVSSLNAPAR